MVAAGHVLAGSAVHAGVGFALVVVDVTVRTTPARVAGAFVADAKGKRACFSELHVGNFTQLKQRDKAERAHPLIRSWHRPWMHGLLRHSST